MNNRAVAVLFLICFAAAFGNDAIFASPNPHAYLLRMHGTKPPSWFKYSLGPNISLTQQPTRSKNTRSIRPLTKSRSRKGKSNNSFVPLLSSVLWPHYFLTSSCSEHESIERGWTPTNRPWLSSGYQYFVDSISGAHNSTEPLYRMYNSGDGDHFYTTSKQEHDGLLGHGYADEGIVGYVSAVKQDDSTALHRLYNDSNGQHWYVVDGDEIADLTKHGWHEEGVIGYVFRGGVNNCVDTTTVSIRTTDTVSHVVTVLTDVPFAPHFQGSSWGFSNVSASNASYGYGDQSQDDVKYHVSANQGGSI